MVENVIFSDRMATVTIVLTILKFTQKDLRIWGYKLIRRFFVGRY